MSGEKIEVTISESGEVQVAVNGCPGPDCRRLTAELEASLGSTESVQKTREFSQVKSKSQQQARR